MANLIVNFVDKEFKVQKRRGSSTQVVPGGGVEGGTHSRVEGGMNTMQKEWNKIDFGEFMVSSEQGQMMSWDSYLETAVQMAKVNPNLDRGACEAAFLKARRGAQGRLDQGRLDQGLEIESTPLSTLP